MLSDKHFHREVIHVPSPTALPAKRFPARRKQCQFDHPEWFNLDTILSNVEKLMKTAISLLVVVVCLPVGAIHAQVCPPVGVFYIVRDDTGKPLTEVELKPVFDRLPKTIGVASATIGAATVRMSSTPVNEDGSLRPYPYFGETVTKTIPALSFLNGYPCRMHFEELTLTYRQKTMRLLFNLDLDPNGVRILVIDSPSLQDGTFALGAPKAQTIVPAQQWKKLSDKP